MIAADFGCGSGGWTIPLAKRLENGKVFAVDIKEEAFSALKSKARLQGVSNIREIKGNLEEGVLELRSSMFDLVLMTDLLFQLDGKDKVFKEANRVLKPKGMVLVVDWKPNTPFGPKNGCVGADEVKSIAGQAGFSLEKELKAGDYHYALLFVKNELL